MKETLTADQARELLTYDPDTGSFFWRVDRGSKRAGSRAGNLDVMGYIRVRVLGTLHHGHRLAWLMTSGAWPALEIDHANGNRSDNRISNLRLATRVQQGQNKSIQRNNTSGFKGVCWFKPRKKWKAEIQVNRKSVHLGYFDNPEDAAGAYRQAALKHFGDFARLS